MDGYKFEIETPEGQVVPHYEVSNQIEYVNADYPAIDSVKAALDYLFENGIFDLDINSEGYWVINGQTTNHPSRGPQGEPGESGSVIYVGGEGGSSVINSGTFAQAYAYATTPQEIEGETVDFSNTVFQWLLRETDDNNNTIVKMIYHVGDGTFIDALGGRVIGRLDGVNIS